ncbi:hypothetical protein ABT324_15580 [Saccharopolyspora sp. NPDC000359]|uniref:hypothetical protein n=1 Tax=Saccharopolyspora sp. NPDC000359 TaxID=3154251 RepID=UPI0033330702
MKIDLGVGVAVSVNPGPLLEWQPRFALSGLTVHVGPYLDSLEHEHLFLRTVGSGDWHEAEDDELRFDRHSGMLESLMFHVPEDPVLSPPACGGEVAEGEDSVQLVLGEGRNFSLPRSKSRYVSERGDVLICLRSGEAAGCSTGGTLLNIAPELYLIAQDNRLQGWMLRHPERCLTSSWEVPGQEPPDAELSGFLARYFALTASPNNERIADGDPEVLQALTELSRSLDPESGATTRRAVLRAAIADLVDFFS